MGLTGLNWFKPGYCAARSMCQPSHRLLLYRGPPVRGTAFPVSHRPCCCPRVTRAHRFRAGASRPPLVFAGCTPPPCSSMWCSTGPPPLLPPPRCYRPLLKAVTGAARQSFSPHRHHPIIEHAKAPISPPVTTLHSSRQKPASATKIRAAAAVFPLPSVSSIVPPFPSLFGLLLTFCSFLGAPRPRCRHRRPLVHLHRPGTPPPEAPPPPHRCRRPLLSHVTAYLARHVPLGPLLLSLPASCSITGR
jgi:hypothetical protein